MHQFEEGTFGLLLGFGIMSQDTSMTMSMKTNSGKQRNECAESEFQIIFIHNVKQYDKKYLQSKYFQEILTKYQVQAGKIIIQFTHIQDIHQVPKINIKANVIQVHLANVNLHQHIQANQVHVNLSSTGNLV